MSQEDLTRTLEGIQQALDRLGGDAAKRLASDTADERIAAWEKRKLSIVVVILAIFGIASYASLADKVANYFVESVKPRIEDEVKKKTVFVSAQDPDISELRSQLADLSKSLAEVSKALAEGKVVKPTGAPPVLSATTPAAGGYSFFGIRDVSGQWSERYFDIEGGGDRPPRAGDKLVATGSVNVRQGYIVYSDAGWVNKRSIGVLRKGDVVHIDEVREVVAGFWWVSFTSAK
jgi:hypothetical protein